MKSAYVSFVVAALVAGACAHDNASLTSSRGQPVGVNSVDAKSAPVTGSLVGGIGPSPSAMATTTSSPAPVDTSTSLNAGMGAQR